MEERTRRGLHSWNALGDPGKNARVVGTGDGSRKTRAGSGRIVRGLWKSLGTPEKGMRVFGFIEGTLQSLEQGGEGLFGDGMALKMLRTMLWCYGCLKGNLTDKCDYSEISYTDFESCNECVYKLVKNCWDEVELREEGDREMPQRALHSLEGVAAKAIERLEMTLHPLQVKERELITSFDDS